MNVGSIAAGGASELVLMRTLPVPSSNVRLLFVSPLSEIKPMVPVAAAFSPTRAIPGPAAALWLIANPKNREISNG